MNQEIKKIIGGDQEKQPSKKSRVKLFAILAILLIIVSAGFYAVYRINQFFENHKLVFRTPVQSPVLIVKREIAVPQAQAVDVLPQPLTDKDKILSRDNGMVLWRMYGLESQFGAQDNCKKSGLFNGFGWRQNSKEWRCYKTLDEVVDAVDAWVTSHKDMPLPEMICYYNTGNKIRNCDYYQNYLALKVQ